MSDPKCPWCGKKHTTETLRVGEIEVSSCPRLDGQDSVTFAFASMSDLVAAVRLIDGSQVVAYAPVGLEVRAFGADDLDERGLPRGMP